MMIDKIIKLFKIIRAHFRINILGGLNLYLNHRITNCEFIYKQVLHGFPVYVLYDDDVLMATNYKHSSIYVIGFTYFTRKIIIVLSEEIKKLGIESFMIQHEIGHVLNEVLSGSEISEKETLENNIIADDFALDINGVESTCRALNIIHRLKWITDDEYYARCKNIRK